MAQCMGERCTWNRCTGERCRGCSHFMLARFQASLHWDRHNKNSSRARWGMTRKRPLTKPFTSQRDCNSDGCMFIIVYGHAEVRKTSRTNGQPSIVATIGSGAIFGEVSLLLDTPRMASVVACGHCHIYTLSRDAFETLAVVYASWWKDLTSERGTLLKQLKETGIGTSARKTKTHNLTIPELTGLSVSSMLQAAEMPTAIPACGIPEGRLCLVCRSQEKCMLSTPCGHITACEDCQKNLTACTLCRRSIDSSIRAYF